MLEDVYRQNYLWKENWRHICFNVLNENWDWVNLTSGKERTGKTNHSFWNARVCSDYGLKFDWTSKLSNVFFGEKDLYQKLLAVPPKSFVVLDEGAEMLFSRRAMERANISLIQLLMAYGTRNIILQINIPSFRYIDKYIRQRRISSLEIVKSFPHTILRNGERYHTRIRGFYQAYNGTSARKASGGELGGQEKLLRNAGYHGYLPGFKDYWPDIWAAYEERKMEFLLNKSKKTQVEGKKEAKEVDW